MDNIFIKADELTRWLAEKHFKDKDLISLEELLAEFEYVSDELGYLQDEFENYKEYVKSNYKEMSVAEQVE